MESTVSLNPLDCARTYLEVADAFMRGRMWLAASVALDETAEMLKGDTENPKALPLLEALAQKASIVAAEMEREAGERAALN